MPNVGIMLAETTPVAAPDFSPLVTALQTGITPEQIITILATVVGIGMGFVLVWFGARKSVGIFMSAFKKGKIRV